MRRITLNGLEQFVIQALHARPPAPSTDAANSLLPSTPRAGSPSGSGGFSTPRRTKWTDYLRVPIFSLAVHAIDALGWLGVAAGRDRSGLAVGGKERGDKRLR